MTLDVARIAPQNPAALRFLQGRAKKMLIVPGRRPR